MAILDTDLEIRKDDFEPPDPDCFIMTETYGSPGPTHTSGGDARIGFPDNQYLKNHTYSLYTAGEARQLLQYCDPVCARTHTAQGLLVGFGSLTGQPVTVYTAIPLGLTSGGPRRPL